MSDKKKRKPLSEASAREWEPDNSRMCEIQAEEKPKKNRFTGESKK